MKEMIWNRTGVVDPIGILPFSFDLEKGKRIEVPQEIGGQKEIQDTQDDNSD